MVVASFQQTCRRIVRGGALCLLLALPGCCGNLLVSERFGDPLAGDCHSGICQPDSVMPTHEDGSSLDDARQAFPRPALPPLPTFCWPGWLNCDRLWLAHHQVKENFSEMLQPGPPPPVKPPHSRFHPVPTQAVFSPRAEYSPPEVLGIKPEELQMLREAQVPANNGALEAIPTPLPEAENAPEPLSAPVPSPALLPLSPPASAQRPRDPSKGPVAQVKFLSVEPNPLRP